MGVVTKKVEMYEVDYRCDECGDGWLRPTGSKVRSWPVKFVHRCLGCGWRKDFELELPTFVSRDDWEK